VLVQNSDYEILYRRETTAGTGVILDSDKEGKDGGWENQQ